MSVSIGSWFSGSGDLVFGDDDSAALAAAAVLLVVLLGVPAGKLQIAF
jgi:hypothetical protein